MEQAPVDLAALAPAAVKAAQAPAALIIKAAPELAVQVARELVAVLKRVAQEPAEVKAAKLTVKVVLLIMKKEPVVQILQNTCTTTHKEVL